ncbi:MAG TPA: hypothetical protein ENH12_00630 [Proteobacteria bacterium]|nr:hypothetical protein [Pseudomonadota bacterium]
MRAFLVIVIFALVGVFIAHSLVSLQTQSFNLWAFVAMVISVGLLLVFPRIGFGLIIGIVLFYDPRFSFPGIHLWLHQWVILVALVVLIGRYLHLHRSFKFHPLDGVLAVLLLTFLISYINSPDIGLSVKWTLYYFMMVLCYFLFRLGVTDRHQLRNIIVMLILSGLINSVVSMVFSRMGAGRPGALVLSRPNALGNYLALILPLGMALLFFSPFSRKLKAWCGAAVLIISISLILTLSRSSWLGVIVGLLALGFFKPRPIYFLIIFLCLGGVLLLPEVKQRVVDDREDSGVYYRRAKNDMAYLMFKEYPIVGRGPGSFQALAVHSDFWGIKAHSGLENLYLRLLAEGGLLQALAFIIFYIYLTHLGLTTARSLPPGLRQAAVLGALAGCWAVLGCGLGDDPFINPMINWVVGIYLGIIVSISQSTIPGSEEPGSYHPQPFSPQDGQSGYNREAVAEGDIIEHQDSRKIEDQHQEKPGFFPEPGGYGRADAGQE